MLDISVGSLVQRGTALSDCGEVIEIDGDELSVVWVLGGRSRLLPKRQFKRICDVHLKREVARLMVCVSQGVFR